MGVAGGATSFSGTLATAMQWTNGTIAGAWTLAGGGRVTMTGPGNLYLRGPITNFGSLVLSNALSFDHYDAQIRNQAGAVMDVLGNWTVGNSYGYTGTKIINAGTHRKSADTGTNIVGNFFDNTGLLDIRHGMVALNAGYSLSGTMTTWISSTSDYGSVSLPGTASLGAMAAIVLPDTHCVLHAGDAFVLASYGSPGSSFSGLDLPVTAAWLTNYGASELVITVANTRPVLDVITNRTLNELELMTVTNRATDSDLPANTLSYSLLVAPGNASISTNGVITWTPIEAQGPCTNTFTTRVVDDGSPALSATNTFVVVVNEVNVAPVFAAITNRTINPGQTVSLTATATDADLLANTLSFTRLSGQGSITSDGAFSWRAPVSSAGTTNVVTLRVADNGSPVMSATNAFSIVVSALTPVTLEAVGLSAGGFTLRMNGTAGPDYIILGGATLTNWNPLVTNTPQTLPQTWTDTNVQTMKCYRVLLGP